MEGYKRQAFYGTPGSTAAAQILHLIDVDVNGANSRFDDTDRGDGLSVPIHTEQIDQLNRTIKLSMHYYIDDAVAADMLAAEATGATIALLVKRYNGGPTEYDGDVTLNLTSPGPLTGGMVMDFDIVPAKGYGRYPSFGP